MPNGRLDKPVYQLPEQLSLFGIEDAVLETEGAALSAEEIRQRSERALAGLSALRYKENIYTEIEGKIHDLGKKDVEPRWMDQYRKLRDGGWEWRVAVYIAWASQPKKYRWPETQEDLARQCLGLTSDRAIATWRKKNPAIDETISMLQGSIIFDSLSDAFGAMVDVATTSNYKGHQDRKLMFEMAGVYVPSSKLTAEMVRKLGKGGGLEAEDMTDDELRAIEAAAGEALVQRAQERDQAEKPE